VKPTQQNDRVSAHAQPRASQPAIAWSWPHALVGVVYAIPAAGVTLRDPQLGIPLAVGVLPAAMVGIPPRRRGRLIILVIGVLAGASLFLGGVLAHLPLVLAAILLAAAVVGAALWRPLSPSAGTCWSCARRSSRPGCPMTTTRPRRRRCSS
jgi:hypothetical protein